MFHVPKDLSIVEIKVHPFSQTFVINILITTISLPEISIKVPVFHHKVEGLHVVAAWMRMTSNHFMIWVVRPPSINASNDPSHVSHVESRKLVEIGHHDVDYLLE